MSTSEPTEVLRFPGRVVALGGRSYTIPPIRSIDLPQVARHLERVVKAKGRDGGPLDRLDQMADVGAIVFFAIRRNYPTMTRAELDEMLDAPSLAPALAAALANLQPPSSPALPPRRAGSIC